MYMQGETPLGLFRSEDAALRFLADSIMISCEPQSIWLFGSRARGDCSSDSDVDLLVVMPDGRDTDIARQLHRAIGAGGLAVDILICSETEFRDYADARGTIVEQVHRHGRRLYADKATVMQERARARMAEVA